MDEFDARQELLFIRKVIDDGRTALGHDGKAMIVWGAIVVAGMIAMFLSVSLTLGVNYLILWGVLIGAGWIFTLFFDVSARRKARFSTFGGRVVSQLWLGCGIVMTVVGFVTPLVGALKPWAIIPIMSLILGIAYLVTGAVYDDRWIRFSSVAWWLSGIIMLVWPGVYMFLVFASLVIAFQIVPGVRLFKQWKARQGTDRPAVAAQ